MPTLKEILQLICETSQAHGIAFGDQCAREMELQIRKAWPAERVYIPPANSRQDAARSQAIRNAATRLPTGVVAQRFGVSRSYVSRLVKK